MKTLGELRIEGFDYLKKITAVDYNDHLEIVYMLYNTYSRKDETIIVKLPSANPQIETALTVFKAADWYERELSEMFGIKILGRKTKRLLLEKWNGTEAPLRKRFVWGNPDYKR